MMLCLDVGDLGMVVILRSCCTEVSRVHEDRCKSLKVKFRSCVGQINGQDCSTGKI